MTETLVDEIARILRCTPKTLAVRVVKMGLGITCSRCGGTGKYSYNAMDGSRCYGCGGLGSTMPRKLQKLKMDAEKAVESGELDAYLAQLRKRRDLKDAKQRVLDAWHSVFEEFPYDWRRSYGKDADPVAAFRGDQSAICSQTWDEFSKLIDEFTYPTRGKDPVDPDAVARALERALDVIAGVRATLEQHEKDMAS